MVWYHCYYLYIISLHAASNVSGTEATNNSEGGHVCENMEVIGTEQDLCSQENGSSKEPESGEGEEAKI